MTTTTTKTFDEDVIVASFIYFYTFIIEQVNFDVITHDEGRTIVSNWFKKHNIRLWQIMPELYQKVVKEERINVDYCSENGYLKIVIGDLRIATFCEENKMYVNIHFRTQNIGFFVYDTEENNKWVDKSYVITERFTLY